MAKRRRSKKKGGFGRSMRAGNYSVSGLIRSPISTLKPAFTGAVGAILVNTALNAALPRVPMLGTLMSGRLRYLTQAVAAIGLAAAAQRFGGVSGSTAAKMAEGALTVTLVDAIRDVAGQFGVPLSGGIGYYLPGYSAGADPRYSASRPAVGVAGVSRYMTGPGSGSSVIPMRRSALGGRAGMGNISTSFKF